MNLVFNTPNKALFQEKIDVDIYLEMDPLMNEIYEILIEALRTSRTYKSGHIFKMAFALCDYILSTKHPEEMIAEMKELLDNETNPEIRDLTLATVLVLLRLYRSPDGTTDDKIRRTTNLIQKSLEYDISYYVKDLIFNSNFYSERRKHANLDFHLHEGFVFEAEMPTNVSVINEDVAVMQECFSKADSRLKYLQGIYPSKAIAIMKPEEHERLLEYIRSFILTGETPSNIKKINATIGSMYFLRYSFYLIYLDLKGTIAQYNANKWINLLFAIFTNFEGASESTHVTKFSEKPEDYEKTVELIEKSLVSHGTDFGGKLKVSESNQRVS